MIPATVSYNPTNDTVTLIPTAPLSTLQTYTVYVKGGAQGVTDLAGNPVATDNATSFLTPAQVASTWSAIWSPTISPTTVDSGDTQPIEVGTKFLPASLVRSLASASTRARRYRDAHRQLVVVDRAAAGDGHLRRRIGHRLAAVDFHLARGDHRRHDVCRLVPYQSGHYSDDQNYFASPYTSGPLTVPVSGGVYLYGAGGFPTQNYNNSNYWVQPILRVAPPVDNVAPTIIGITPAAGTTGVSVNPSITVAFSEAIDPTTATSNQLRLMDQYNHLVPTTVTYNAQTFTATITPTSALAFGSDYTIVVAGGAHGVRDLAGNPVAATIGSSFTTTGSLVPDTTPPIVIDTSPASNATGYTVSGAGHGHVQRAVERRDRECAKCQHPAQRRHACRVDRRLQSHHRQPHDYPHGAAGLRHELHGLHRRRLDRHPRFVGQHIGEQFLVLLHHGRRASAHEHLEHHHDAHHGRRGFVASPDRGSAIYT